MAAARGEFSSRFGFLMAASGSAVGLGNIWGFPTNAASNGGAAFLFTYL
ncbi:MAG TPA: sodium-dependent transporter, partial [Gammaproteobacteria bacterium]|nr:sodium-dependent transporter [Gammaproteobacteria bacterium]